MNAGANDQFEAVPMGWQYAAAAYPLVRLHDASITLDKWRRFARRHGGSADKRSGLIAIRDCRGLVHALFSYRVDFDLHNRKRLCVTNLIVAHVPGSQIDDVVAASARDLQAQYGCHTITVEQPFRPAPTTWKCPPAEAMTQGASAGSRVH